LDFKLDTVISCTEV